MGKFYRILGKKGRVTIPLAVRQRVGFAYGDVLSFAETEDGEAVIVRRERLCDNCEAESIRSDDETVFELLNGFTDAQRELALMYLSVKQRRKDKGAYHGRA